MNPQELNAWIVLVGVALDVGSRTVAGIKELFATAGMSEDDQNAVLDAVLDENKRRRAISAAIAGI